MAYGKGLATDINVVTAIDTLPVDYTAQKQEFNLVAAAFSEPLKGHVLKLMERLGLPADHPVVTVLFEGGIQKAVYQPVMVGKDGKLFLKVATTLIPVTLESKGFVINGKAATLQAGITTNKKAFLSMNLTFKDLPGVNFSFGAIFSESAVQEQLATDSQGGQLLRTLQGFIANYDPEEGRIIPPTQEAFTEACSLLFQWGGGQGNILRMGHLNQMLDEYENPLEYPMVFWIDGAKLQLPKPGAEIQTQQFLIWGSFSPEIKEAFPELENVTCLSFNQPSEKSKNWQAWAVLKAFAERNEIEGSAIKIVAISNPAHWCPHVAFFNRAKVEAIGKELAANPSKLNVLGLTQKQIELYSGTFIPNMMQRLAEKYAQPVPDTVDWEPATVPQKALAQAATQEDVKVTIDPHAPVKAVETSHESEENALDFAAATIPSWQEGVDPSVTF